MCKLWVTQFNYRKDTEPLNHSFMYSLVSIFFPVSIHYLQWVHCLLHHTQEIYVIFINLFFIFNFLIVDVHRPLGFRIWVGDKGLVISFATFHTSFSSPALSILLFLKSVESFLILLFSLFLNIRYLFNQITFWFADSFLAFCLASSLCFISDLVSSERPKMRHLSQSFEKCIKQVRFSYCQLISSVHLWISN